MSNRVKTRTESWLIQQMWNCRQEANLYQTERFKNNPSRFLAASYMQRSQENYRVQLRLYRGFLASRPNNYPRSEK